MKKLFVILSFLISIIVLTSQSWGLPPCPTTGIKHNCYGNIVYQYSNNNYIGEFQNNKKNGQGKFITPNGDIYKGYWKNDQFDGHGSMYWSDGDKYIGEWRLGKRNGLGIFTHANGIVKEGIWKDNDFMYAQKIQKTEKKYVEASKPKSWSKELDTLQTEIEKQIEIKKLNNQRNEELSNVKTVFFSGGSAARIKINEKYDLLIEKLVNTSSKDLDIVKRQAEETKQKRLELERKLALLEKQKQSNEAIGTIKQQEEEDKQKIIKLEQQLALIKKEQQSKPKTIVKTEPKSKFSNKPINVNFKSIAKRPDDIAVIIGNANYEKMGKDIPNVNPAYADAEGIKQYFMQALGVKEGNIIYLKDATGSQLASVFGNQNTHKGQLYNWVKKESNVYIYYAGHGVPGGEKGNAYLVPTDANAQTIGLSGYPLETLYSNLGKLSAKSITVILEACFSGASQAGNLFSKSSPIVIRAKKTMIPKNVKVISAGAVDQMASWEQDNSHGLFTKYFLKAMSGEGDKNNDGKVSDTELKNYLGETMTYYARRYYGRDQNVQIMQGN